MILSNVPHISYHAGELFDSALIASTLMLSAACPDFVHSSPIVNSFVPSPEELSDDPLTDEDCEDDEESDDAEDVLADEYDE